MFGKDGLPGAMFGIKAPEPVYYAGWPPRRVYPQKVVRRARSQRTARFDNFNLAVNMPRGNWIKIDPKKTGSRACLLMRHSNPTIVVSLAAERVGLEANDTNDSLLAASQAKMESLPEGVIQSGERQLKTHGIEGVAYEASAVAENGATVHYSIWVAAHNGYSYSLAVFGEQRDQPAIDEAMSSFLNGIKPINPKRVARANSKSGRG
jgi:hypothetical protein